MSRLAMNVTGSQTDFSQDPRFTIPRAGRDLLRPRLLPQGIGALHHHRHAHERGAGATVAEVNLKFIWDVVNQIKIGRAGKAFVVDGQGALIAPS